MGRKREVHRGEKGPPHLLQLFFVGKSTRSCTVPPLLRHPVPPTPARESRRVASSLGPDGKRFSELCQPLLGKLWESEPALEAACPFPVDKAPALQAHGWPRTGAQGADGHVPVPVPVPGLSPGGAEQRRPPAPLLGGNVYPGQCSWVTPIPGMNSAPRSRWHSEQAAAGQSRAMALGGQSCIPTMSAAGSGWREWRSSSRTSMWSPARAAKYNQWDRCSKTGARRCRGGC